MTKKNVSRVDGSNTSQDNDILVKGEGFGSVGAIVPEMLSGLTSIEAEDFVPPAVGALGTVLGTIIMKKWGWKISAALPQVAPLAGILGGVLASVPLFWWKGSGAMASGIISAVIVGASAYGIPRLEQQFAGVFVSSAPYGLLEATQIGSLPEVTDAGATPAAVASQMDPAAFGQVP